MDKNLVLVSGAVIFKESSDKTLWFLIRQSEEGGWEIPKVTVRKGESSVRAVLRMSGEKASMSARVLEEVGRAGGVVTLNGKTLPQRHIYYLMLLKSASREPVGFPQHLWLDYPTASKKLSSKRDKVMLKEAQGLYRKWKKERSLRRRNQNLHNSSLGSLQPEG